MKTTTPPTGHLGSRTFRQSAVLDAQLAVVHRLQSLLAKLPAVCQSVVINSSLLGSGAVVSGRVVYVPPFFPSILCCSCATH